MNVAGILIGDVAIRENISAAEGTPLKNLLSMMERNQKGVAVLLRGGKPLGILTERDAVALLFSKADLNGPADQFSIKLLITARETRTIAYALNLMIANDIRRLVVVNNTGDFIGVVTQKDILHHLEEDFYRSDIYVRHIADQLKDLISAEKEETIHAVLEKMVHNRISAVPILEEGRALGIITEKDILKLANTMVSLGENISNYMSSPVVCADVDTKIVDIVRTMNVRNISRVIINNREGKAWKIITNRDLVRNLEGDYNEFLERKLRNTKEVLNLLPEMLLELIDTGYEQLVVWANVKVLERFGKQIVDRPITDLVPDNTWSSIYETLLNQSRIEDVRFNIDESIFECSGFYLPLEGPGEKGRMQLILRDITEEVMLATTDSLTSAYNRRFMIEFLEKETERSKRTKKKFAVVLADLDDFKQINDTYGHMAGDEVLKAVVKVITTSTRRYDLVGRYGGEEFLIILPEIDKADALSVVERIRREIEKQEIPVAKVATVRITASFGVVFFDEDGLSPDSLLLLADQRLYGAKRAGKNRIFYE